MRASFPLQSIYAMCIAAILGCVDSAAVPSVREPSSPRMPTQQTEVAPREIGVEPQVVESELFVYTGGITALALLVQSDMGPYIESIVKSDENLTNVVSAIADHATVAHDKLSVEWLKNNLTIREFGSGNIAIGISTNVASKREAIEIVNATAETFCNREPSRIAGEVLRITAAMQQNLKANPGDHNEKVVQNMIRVFNSERFRESPRILKLAGE